MPSAALCAARKKLQARRCSTDTRNRGYTGSQYKWWGEQLHDLILFMSNTGMRPDEILRLEYRVTVAFDEGTQETILEIEVRGKRGYGPCKSTQNAVPVFERLKERNKPQPTDKIFPKSHHAMFNQILGRAWIEVRPGGTPPHPVQLAAHLHLLPPDGGRRDQHAGQELPDQR